MKDTIRLSVFALCISGLTTIACFLTSKTKQLPSYLTQEEISWVEFCKTRGYDTQDKNEEIINEFLDTWVGSVEEEQAFNNLPAEEA